MADVKISALPAATLPLAGTEAVPLVQGGITVQAPSAEFGPSLPLTVADGGTGLSSGTSGGVPYFSASGTISSSGALTLNRIVLGGGAGGAPTVLGSLGTTTTVLHGNAAGAPTFGAVNLATDVTGNLPVTNLNSGTSASATTFWRGDGTWTQVSAAALTGNLPVTNLNSGTGATSSTFWRGDGTWASAGGGGSSNLAYQTSDVTIGTSGTLFSVGTNTALPSPGSYTITIGGSYVNNGSFGTLVLDVQISSGAVVSFMTQGLISPNDEGTFFVTMVVNVVGNTYYFSTLSTVFSDNDGLLSVTPGGLVETLGSPVTDLVVLTGHWNAGGSEIYLQASSVQYVVAT